MKYTKQYKIHPKPEKQFSGASIFAQGGKLPGDDKSKTKTYTNKAEYDKANQAYNDSLYNYNWTQEEIKKLNISNPEIIPFSDKDNLFSKNIFPTGKGNQKATDVLNYTNKNKSNTQYIGVFDNPIIKPTYLEKIMMPSGNYMQKDDFIKRYGEKPWMKATGQKFAFGGKMQYPEGGEVKKTYTDIKEYEKAKQAYNDTLASNQITQDNLDVFEMLGWQKDPITIITQKDYNKINPIADMSEFNYKGIDAFVGLRKNGYATDAFPVYKKPVVKPEYKALGNPIMSEGERQKLLYLQEQMEARYKPDLSLTKLPIKSAQITNNQEVPAQKVPVVNAPVMGTERYVPYTNSGGNPNIPLGYWDKGMGKKETQYGYGGYKRKYLTGGSFYDSSNINTSKPQVNNTVPSSYTDSFAGNTSSKPKSSTSTGQYLDYAGQIIGGGTRIYNTLSNDNLTTPQKAEQTADATVDTAFGVVGTAIPVVGAAYGIGTGIGDLTSKIGEGDNQVVTSRDGKQVTKTSNQGSQVVGDTLSNAFNPSQNVKTAAKHYSTEGDWWKGLIDTFLPTVGPVITTAIDRQEDNKLADQYYMSNANMLKDQKAQNFAAYGGYKKGMCADGGYLKDSISNFQGQGFKKHSEGGVAIDASNEVEEGEIKYKDYIFSDRLKHSSGKSYAEIAARLVKQIGK